MDLSETINKLSIDFIKECVVDECQKRSFGGKKKYLFVANVESYFLSDYSVAKLVFMEKYYDGTFGKVRTRRILLAPNCTSN